VEESPLGSTEDFLKLWDDAAEMLTSYSDEQFVSEAYARELSGARTQALEVERVSDDPPERIGEWITSVGPSELRALDLRLLLDLLTIESDPERWRKVTVPAIGHIEDLLLVGDFDGAMQLVNVFAGEVQGETPKKSAAQAALGKLVDGSMMWHVTSHLRTVDDAAAEQIKTLCHAVGPSVIKPLAEALAIEKRTSTRQRLTQLLIRVRRRGASIRRAAQGVGQPGGAADRHLPAARVRGIRGAAGPDGAAGRCGAHIQKEAVRAILAIGTEEAYAELQKALATATDKTRESLVGSLIAMRNERAIPLFEYIVRKIDRKGPLRSVYLRAIESLGALKADHTIELLKEALYSGEWWAPFRTAELRRAAATALRHIGTPDALRVLQDAAEHGPRGVRAIAKAVRS
jgi:HEAT repeat protein